MSHAGRTYPITPDGRYFVIRGMLWRATNPHLPEDRRVKLVAKLMDARRDIAQANRDEDDAARTAARKRVDVAKTALGERGAVSWTDGAPDYNRKMASNTPYADWFAHIESAGESD